jgi:hypothetical protein
VVKEVDHVNDGCDLCVAQTYTYRAEFGFDGQGPWATLGCSEEGCEAHQACRPLWNDGDGTATTDVDLFGALWDFAEQDGWEMNAGAWCPEHKDR